MAAEGTRRIVPRQDLEGSLGSGEKRWEKAYMGNVGNVYGTVADMVADLELREGSTVSTKGYHAFGDGGHGFYNIREKLVSDVDDDGSIIFLDNGNVAELIAPQDNFWNVMLYGICPNTGDNYLRIYTMIKNTVYKTGGTLYFPKGKYTTSYTLFIPENTTLTGDGADSEIYFNETDTTFGVCIANAGSNVTIRNIKISQFNKGIFHSGSQPGCIGIGGMAKVQAIEPPYSHTFNYGEAQNLIVENVWFDGFYPLQCEPGNYSVHNVVYRNLYCPDGCVSIESNTGEVNNITVDNVVCDLFRIKANRTDIGKYCNNVNVSNVVCNTLFINGANREKKCCTIKNLVMTKNERHNDFLLFPDDPAPVYSVSITGNIYFEDCYFTSISGEINGIAKYECVQEFKNCIFDFENKILVNNVVGNDNYIIAENCYFKTMAPITTPTYLRGYGKNNKYDGHIVTFLWGDIHGYYFAMDHETSASTHPNRLYFDGDKIRLSIYSFKVDGTLFSANNKLKHMPWASNPIPIQLWNYSNRTGTAINTYGKIDSNGLISVTEVGVNEASYDRALIDCDMVLSRIPTPTEVYNTLLELP